MKIQQTIVIIAMLIILPFLAYLQYTWLGQISEQEYERMKGNLQINAFHCSMDFSREITDLMKSLDGVFSGSNDNMQKLVHTRILTWKATSTYPALVSSETKIISSPFPEQTFPIFPGEKSMLLLFKDLSAITIPIKNRPRQVILVSLNLEYISSFLLPKIIQTNFSPSVQSEYDITIVNEGGTLLYSTVDTSKNVILRKADLIYPFLIFPSTPPNRSIRDRMRPGGESAPEPFERNPQDLERRQDVPPPQEHMGTGESEWRMREHGLFELRLKHRKSSLEAVVNYNRLRNLGISFGVLILLGASIVFLLLSTNRARRLAQQQLEFVAGISHELRTPLAVLKSAGENLADGVIQGKDHIRKYGELIKNEVMRLSEMVEKALTYAGIQSGKQRYESHRLNVASIITEAIRNVKKLLPSDDITTDIEIDQNLPLIHGDATALQSALENLIINGLKYSLEKKWIGIKIHRVKDSNGSFVEINVEDHGIGIAAADISNIYKPFYRGRNVIEGQIQGSGIGLSITKHIIESHKGTIFVKSSPHGGSIFTILLPSLTEDEESM